MRAAQADVVMKRFLTWLVLRDGERIVRIKSLWPYIGPHGVEWPVLLIDKRGGQRQTIAPVWDWARLTCKKETSA